MYGSLNEKSLSENHFELKQTPSFALKRDWRSLAKFTFFDN